MVQVDARNVHLVLARAVFVVLFPIPIVYDNPKDAIQQQHKVFEHLRCVITLNWDYLITRIDALNLSADINREVYKDVARWETEQNKKRVKMSKDVKKVLILLTNEAFLPKSGRGRYSELASWTTIHETAGGSFASAEDFTKMHKWTGVDAYEVAYFWLAFRRHFNCEVTFCSPRGGSVSLDPSSYELVESDSKLCDRLKNDKEFMSSISHTYPVKWINPEEYDVCLIPGRHGAMFDLTECREVSSCIARIYENGGWIGAIGHGVSALLNVKSSSSSSSEQQQSSSNYLISNKRVTCPSNAEEREKRFDEYLPFLIEEKCRERGAKVDTSKPFAPHVVVEERLITGQSSPSIKQFISKFADHLGKSENIKDLI